MLLERGVAECRILFLSLIAAPEGINKICSTFPRVKVITSEIDGGIGEDYQVIPGAFPDRLCSRLLMLSISLILFSFFFFKKTKNKDLGWEPAALLQQHRLYPAGPLTHQLHIASALLDCSLAQMHRALGADSSPMQSASAACS